LRLLIPNVSVLKQDQTSTTGVGGQNGSNATSDVTVQVDDRQAARLAFASDNGKVWLALRPANASAPDRRLVVSLESILFGNTALPVGRRGR
jgi:Flp pilus assembly protein CpaB